MSQELLDSLIGQAVTSKVSTGVLIEKLLDFPQAPCNVRHIYGEHVYMRELTAAAGALIVGRRQRLEHDCILVRGALTFFNEDGTQTKMLAPLEVRSTPGRKIARVDEDMTFVNVYRTDLTDVEEIEAAIFEDPAPPDRRPMLEPDGDFEAMLAEQGASAEAVRRASVRTDDCCPFPSGAYKVKVGRSLIEGRGLIATADIPAQEFIAPGTWAGKRTPAGRYTNHAKSPNAGFIYGTDGIAWLVSLRDIAGSRGGFDGEEITVDYRRTPRARWEQLS
jgi:hypothetical protein